MMKSDGYFALSDLLEIPNLRQRATTFSANTFKSIFFGIPKPKDKASFFIKVVFLAYGMVLPFYRASVVLGISMGIAAKLFVVGMVLGVGYITMEVVKISKKLLSLFFYSPETSSVRGRAAMIGLTVVVLIPLLLVGYPVPGGVSVRAVLRAESETVVRADSEGFLKGLYVRPGDRASVGDVLATVVSPHLDERIVGATAAIEVARLRLRAAEANGVLEADQVRARLAIAQSEIDALLQQKDQQDMGAVVSGVVVSDGEMPKTGAWISKGQVIVRLHGGRTVARTLLTEEQFALVSPKVGDEVQFRSICDGGASHRGVVQRVVRQASRMVSDKALTQLGGGEIAVDPIRKNSSKPYFFVECLFDEVIEEYRHGSSGRILFQGDEETVGRKLWRSGINLANRLRHGSF